MLLVGGMLLTGTSVSALARGIGRGLRRSSGVFHGGDAAARTVARTHADWREERRARAPTRPRPRPAPTDVMSSYPEDDEDFEPTVALADEDDAAFAAAGIFDARRRRGGADVRGRGRRGRRPRSHRRSPSRTPSPQLDLTDARPAT